MENLWKAAFVRPMAGKSLVKFIAWMSRLEQMDCVSNLNHAPIITAPKSFVPERKEMPVGGKH